MAGCCMNDFASLRADFTNPHFSVDLPQYQTEMSIDDIIQMYQ